MARARALMMIVAAVFRAHASASRAALSPIAPASAARFSLSHVGPSSATCAARFPIGHALPQRAGAQAVARLVAPSHSLSPGASSGARALLGVPDSHVEAGIGPRPLSRRGNVAVIAAYTCAAIYKYLDSRHEDDEEDEEDDNSFSLPKICYPPTPFDFGHEGSILMFRRRQPLPPLPTRKDIKDVKVLLSLILKELRRPKPEEWIQLLKTLIIEFLMDPATNILFLYLTVAAVLEELFGDSFSHFECPFSGLIELASASCSDFITEKDNSDGSSYGNIEWGQNMWPPYSNNDGSMFDASSNRTVDPYLASSGVCNICSVRAKGEAEAILARSQATAEGIRMVSESMSAEGSTEAANLRVAEQYIKAFAALAKNTTTMILPSDAGNPSAMIAHSLNIYKHIFKPSSAKGGSPQEEAEEAEQPSVTSGVPLLEGHGSTFTLQRGRSPQN